MLIFAGKFFKKLNNCESCKLTKNKRKYLNSRQLKPSFFDSKICVLKIAFK